MTNLSPKDKAQELADKFDRNITVRDIEGLSKQCALICCNEILEGLAIGTFATSSVDAYEYWQQVKSEIGKH